MSTQSFNIVFAGTPLFSAVTLQALLHSRHKVKAVYTQPDRPSGRGRKVMASAVKELAIQYDLPVYQPTSLKDLHEQEKLMHLHVDMMIVVAYGLLLPSAILTIPQYGCLNVHASLLPRWRGASPIQHAILSGDAHTGITIMQMDQGLDTGPMLYQVPCSIEKEDTSKTLQDRLAELGAEALLYALDHFSERQAVLQDSSLVTYAPKIKKEEGHLDWNLPAEVLRRKICAFNPWPVAFFDYVRVWEATVLEEDISHFQPGTIIKASGEGIDVATGKGVLRLLKLQLPGGRVVSSADMLNARASEWTVGKML